MAREFWHWLATESFAILLGIYFASTACLVAFGVQVYIMSRRLAELSRTAERHDALMERVLGLFDEYSGNRETAVHPAANVAAVASPAPHDVVIPERDKALREAIAAIIAEMSSDDPGGTGSAPAAADATAAQDAIAELEDREDSVGLRICT